MLYEEFLQGTQAPENAHTYSEYVRINKLYMDSNSLTKAEAYKLYQEPSEEVAYLLEIISDLKFDCMTYRSEIRSLETKLGETDSKLQESERKQKTLASVFQDCLKEVDICRQHISNMMYD